MKLSILGDIAPNQAHNSFVTPNCAACAMFPSDPNMMLVAGGESCHVMIVTYDPEINHTTIRKLQNKMISVRSSHKVVFCQNAFYAIGGTNARNMTKRSMEKLPYSENDQIDSQEWVQVEKMNCSRRDFGAVVANNGANIITIGGIDKS